MLNERAMNVGSGGNGAATPSSPAASGPVSSRSRSPPLCLETMNPRVKEMQYAVRGRILLEALKIEESLKQGGRYPFEKVLYANIGNPQAVGQRPITMVRQVAAACLDPSLLEQGVYPSDVVQRAREILADAKGGSLGAYTDSRGLSVVRRHVAEFIESRDGSPADVSRIFLLNGASDGIKALIMTATPPEERVGVMVPIPQYPIYTASITEFGCHCIPYYLDEKKDWVISIQELGKSVGEARGVCSPKIMVAINPGNPTGQLLNESNIRSIIEFCDQEGLLLIADEVYQENIYQKGAKFVSFRKVLKSMGPEYKDFQLVSFHSTSKGYLGECGIRGGYMEMLGFNDLFIDQFYKLCSTKLCPNSIGQVATDVMVKPPQPNDPSFALFDQERRAVLEGLAKKAKMVYEELNKVPGVRCNEVQGSMYAFPQVTIPEEAWEDAKSAGLQLDGYYCLEFLKQKGVCVVPGSGFGQIPGTWHFRTTILPTEEDFKKMLKDFADFHCKFTAKYKRS